MDRVIKEDPWEEVRRVPLNRGREESGRNLKDDGRCCIYSITESGVHIVEKYGGGNRVVQLTCGQVPSSVRLSGHEGSRTVLHICGTGKDVSVL